MTSPFSPVDYSGVSTGAPGEQMVPGLGVGTAFLNQGISGSSLISSDDFRRFVTIALLNGGVAVSMMDPDQLQSLVDELAQDPYVQSIIQQYGGLGALQADPATGTTYAIPALGQAIESELFDPAKTHSQLMVSQGLYWLRRSGQQLSPVQQKYMSAVGPTGGDPAVMSAIAQAASEAGVPYDLALATAMAESGLNPTSVGDHGTSFGLFNLHIGGELTACNLTQAEANDPLTNARCAMQGFVAARNANPGIVSNPGAWAAAAQRPYDPSGYAVRVNNLINTSFGGNPSSQIPRFFDGNWPITQDTGVNGEVGIDYGTNVGTPLYTPFAGIITVEDMGHADWGKRVKVQLSNGYTFAIGHMTSFSVYNGERVNAGALLGLSGGALNDPSSGESSGPHIEVQWISPGGQFLNPHYIVDPILQGNATYAGLNLIGMDQIEGGAAAASPQEHMLQDDPMLDAKYPAAKDAFYKWMGRYPTAGELLNLVAHAGSDPTSLDNYFRTQPSHIPGVSLGAYNDIKGNLDSVSNSLYGFSGTDAMVKELYDSGNTSPVAIKYWLTQQDIAGHLGKDAWAQVYKANQPYMNGIYNESGFDPRTGANQYQQYQQLTGHEPFTGTYTIPKPGGESIVAHEGANAPGFQDQPPPPLPAGSSVARQGAGARGFQ